MRISQRVAQRLRPRRARRPPVVEDEQPIVAREDVAGTIRHAFTEYQGVAEQRRQLGFDVGEANANLIAALTSAGFTEAEARRADVVGGRRRAVRDEDAADLCLREPWAAQGSDGKVAFVVRSLRGELIACGQR